MNREDDEELENNYEGINPLIRDNRPIGVSVIDSITNVIVGVLREAELLRKSWTLPDVAQRIAEESYKIVSSKFLATSREMAMLLRLKENLVIQVEEEVRVLKHVNRKLENENLGLSSKYEKEIKNVERELQNVKCEYLALQKRLYFATRRDTGPNETVYFSREIENSIYKEPHENSVVLKGSYDSSKGNGDNFKTQVYEYKPIDLPLLEDSHKSSGYERNTYRKERNKILRTNVTKGQESIREEKKKPDRILPSLLTYNTTNPIRSDSINLTSHSGKTPSSVIVKDSEGKKSESGERFFKHSFNFSKRGESEGDRRLAPVRFDTTINSKSSDMQKSFLLKQKLPLQGNNLNIDYHKFGVINNINESQNYE